MADAAGRRRPAVRLDRRPGRRTSGSSAAAALELLLERRVDGRACAAGDARRRTAHDVRRGRVGAGLAPARAARPIRPLERIHVVGAAGAGASAAALLAAHAGAIVTGCDPGGPSPYTPALEALGIVVAPEHAADARDAARRARTAWR